MDDNNRFLNSYKKKLGDQEPNTEPNKETPPAREESPSFRYEEKSGFVKPRRPAGQAAPPPGRGPRWIAPAVAGAVVVIGIVIGLLLFLNRGVEVIDFTNWTKNDIALWASDNGVKLQIEEQYNDQYEAARVFAQSPAKGEKLAKGGFLKVTISKGHDLTVALQLPDLMNMTKDQIEAWASENFMTTVRFTAEFNSEVAAGKVISYTINDNTVVDEVRRNTPIYIIVSKGKEDENAVLITVPNFREKTVSESYIFANENGIVLVVNEQYDDFAPKGAIIAQSVKAEEKVRKGDEIALTVSKGKKVTVPDFAEYSKLKASAVAAELGIPVTVTEKYSNLAAGKFISQSIEAGSEYVDGEVMELVYSLGNKLVISSFVGQTRDAIETWAKELNDQGATIIIKVTYTQSSQPKGKILYQDKANTLIDVVATIRITVSKGKAVFVPDFVAPDGSGYDVAVTREEAMAMCEALNIIPVFVASKKTGRLPGEIWYQSIAAGSEVSEETTIILKYNPANVKYNVPDFTGMTEAQIIAGGYYKKFDITIVYADEYVEGFGNQAYKQSVSANTTVVAGTAITITISPPPPEEEPTPTPEPTLSPEPT